MIAAGPRRSSRAQEETEREDPRREDPRPADPGRRGPLTTVTALGAVVTLVTGVIGLVFILLPQLKPEGPPAHTAAHLRELSFDRNVTFRQYLARAGQPVDDLDAPTLARRGVLLTFHFDVIGYKNRPLPLRWYLYDVRSGNHIGEESAITIQGTAGRDEGDWPLWIQAPRRPGRYSVVVELINPAGAVPLATLRSPVFTGKR